MIDEIKHIYFLKPIGLDGPIKIGCSNWPERRLAIAANWSPLPLEIIGRVPGDHCDEKYLHRLFDGDRLHHEWFETSTALKTAIALTLSLGRVPRVIVEKPSRVRKIAP